MPGRPYIAPPAQGKDNALTVDKERFMFNLRHVPAPQMLAQALVERYDGVGPDAAREILACAGFSPTLKRADLPPEQFAQVWSAYHDVMTALTNLRITPWGALNAQGKPAYFWVLPLRHLGGNLTEKSFASTNAALDWFYGERQAAVALENLRQTLARPVRTSWEKVIKRISLQEAALRDAAHADELRLKGELLQAQQHVVPAKVSKIALPNYYEPGSEVEIVLNPSLTASENAQSYFRRYQKAKKTEKQAQLQLEAALKEQAYLESVQEVVERAETLNDLAEVQEELQAQGLITINPQRQKNVVAPATCLSIRSQDGMEILVGKNNRQNDAITMGIAKPDDLWLHVKDIPGAHVVIRTEGKSIADDTLNLALLVAAYYSRARQSSKAPVDYCQRRYVRKPRGAKPGFVIYDHQKTAYVTPDHEEIKRLQL
jgi:predicted ribosome quality control (RQC) complex YloA/Tae2 family protein